MYQAICLLTGFFQNKVCQILQLFLAVTIVFVSMPAASDTQAPFSKPYHKQGRGWYPSMYWSTGRNLGSYYFPNTNGQLFEELESHEWDSDANALVYFYRPESQWASEELEAPSYYINDEIIFNLRGGSYTHVELPAGSYDFAVRKGVLPLLGWEAFDDKLMMAWDFNLQADFGLELDAGSITYIRHSEEVLPAIRHSQLDDDDEMSTADVQLVEQEQAMSELPDTRYLTQSFWHPTDAAVAEELLSGDMQEYGWFTIIWPWSNNFLFGFPIFYLPSDLYRELRGAAPMTLEQELYLQADDTEAYLEDIADRRKVRRNWWAPWRKSASPLTLNEELILDKLERAAREGKIIPAPLLKKESGESVDDGEPWYAYFNIEKKEEAPLILLNEQRQNSMELIRRNLN